MYSAQEYEHKTNGGDSSMQDVTHDRRETRRRRTRRAITVVCLVGLTAVVVVVSLARWQPDFYQVVALPLYDGKPFLPHALNDHGQVVGLVTKVGGRQHVGLWDREHGIRELGIVSDGPLAINNAGQVAGMTVDPNGARRAFLRSPQAGLVPLGRQNVKESMACAVNNKGQVVGSFQKGSEPPHGCIWPNAGGMQDLTPPDAQGGIAAHVNDSRQILGISVGSAEGRSCFWDLTDPNSVEWIPLPDPGDYRDLNNGGYVLGEMLRPAEEPGEFPEKYAMLWHKEHEPIWLFPLPDLNTGVYHLNDANQVVYSEIHRSRLTRWLPRLFPARKRLFLWDPTRGSTPLDAGLRLEKTDRVIVRDLNNQGCVVGFVQSGAGVPKRAVLLEPIAKKWGR